jgi:hypothetical protein
MEHGAVRALCEQALSGGNHQTPVDDDLLANRVAISWVHGHFSFDLSAATSTSTLAFNSASCSSASGSQTCNLLRPAKNSSLRAGEWLLLCLLFVRLSECPRAGRRAAAVRAGQLLRAGQRSWLMAAPKAFGRPASSAVKAPRDSAQPLQALQEELADKLAERDELESECAALEIEIRKALGHSDAVLVDVVKAKAETLDAWQKINTLLKHASIKEEFKAFLRRKRLIISTHLKPLKFVLF